MQPYRDANQNMLPLAKDFALQVFESTWKPQQPKCSHWGFNMWTLKTISCVYPSYTVPVLNWKAGTSQRQHDAHNKLRLWASKQPHRKPVTADTQTYENSIFRLKQHITSCDVCAHAQHYMRRFGRNIKEFCCAFKVLRVIVTRVYGDFAFSDFIELTPQHSLCSAS